LAFPGDPIYSRGVPTSHGPGRRTFAVLVACATLLLLAVAYRTVETPGRVTVIVDTDAGTDDLIALAYLFEREDVQIDLVVAVNGLAHAEAGARNVARLVRAANRRVPVAVGETQPLDGRAAFPDDWRAAAETLPGVTLPDVRRPPRPDGVSALIERLRNSQTPIRLLALGPLTDIAAVVQRDRRAAANIADIVIMGGAIDVAGNAPATASAPVAEWNIYVDPVAAGIVFRSGIPITLVPLDATNQVPLDAGLVGDFTARRHSALGTAVAQLFASATPMIESGGYFAWDPLAAMVLTDPDVVRTRAMAIEVVHTGEDAGRLRARDGDPNAMVAYAASPMVFRRIFFATLTH
jgi:pyrimidine-specific ribonucleoside hydrolase